MAGYEPIVVVFVVIVVIVATVTWYCTTVTRYGTSLARYSTVALSRWTHDTPSKHCSVYRHVSLGSQWITITTTICNKWSVIKITVFVVTRIYH